MTIDLRSCHQVGSGVYADVFAVDELAYKLFKSGPEVPPRQTRDGRRRVFECQCEAFQVACNDPWLRHHIAEFHGTFVVADVIGTDGSSKQESYLLDCCYAIELFRDGEIDVKVTAEWVRYHGHIVNALRRLDQLGINALDSSVFGYADPERFKFIDIEMKNCY